MNKTLKVVFFTLTLCIFHLETAYATDFIADPGLMKILNEQSENGVVAILEVRIELGRLRKEWIPSLAIYADSYGHQGYEKVVGIMSSLEEAEMFEKLLEAWENHYQEDYEAPKSQFRTVLDSFFYKLVDDFANNEENSKDIVKRIVMIIDHSYFLENIIGEYTVLPPEILSQVWESDYRNRNESIIEYIAEVISSEESPNKLANTLKGLSEDRRLNIFSSRSQNKNDWNKYLSRKFQENGELEQEILEKWGDVFSNAFDARENHTEFILSEADVKVLLRQADMEVIKSVVYVHSYLNKDIVRINDSVLNRWSNFLFSGDGLTSDQMISILNEDKINLSYLQSMITNTALREGADQTIKDNVIKMLVGVEKEKIANLLDLNDPWEFSDTTKFLRMMLNNNKAKTEEAIRIFTLNNRSLQDPKKLEVWSKIMFSDDGLSKDQVESLLKEDKINLRFFRFLIKDSVLKKGVAETEIMNMKKIVVNILYDLAKENPERLALLFGREPDWSLDIGERPAWSFSEAADVMGLLWDSGKDEVKVLVTQTMEKIEPIDRRMRIESIMKIRYKFEKTYDEDNPCR